MLVVLLEVSKGLAWNRGAEIFCGEASADLTRPTLLRLPLSKKGLQPANGRPRTTPACKPESHCRRLVLGHPWLIVRPCSRRICSRSLQTPPSPPSHSPRSTTRCMQKCDVVGLLLQPARRRTRLSVGTRNPLTHHQILNNNLHSSGTDTSPASISPPHLHRIPRLRLDASQPREPALSGEGSSPPHLHSTVPSSSPSCPFLVATIDQTTTARPRLIRSPTSCSAHRSAATFGPSSNLACLHLLRAERTMPRLRPRVVPASVRVP